MGHGIRSVVGKREKRLMNPMGLEDFLCLSSKGKQRFSDGITLHFDIRPMNPLTKSQPYRFKKGLLSCEPGGKAFGGTSSVLTPEDFFLCKNPAKKEVSPPSHHILNSFDVYNVNAGTNNHLQIEGFQGLRIQGFKGLPKDFYLPPRAQDPLAPFITYLSKAIISRTA